MKGMLMTPDNHKATRELRKTQTRRLDHLKEINKEPDRWHLSDFYQATGGNNKWWAWFSKDGEGGKPHTIMPRYQVGETVYIKEAHCIECFKNDGVPDACYKTDGDTFEPVEIDCADVKWRSPLFLPEWAARDFILITDVRVERVQEISVEDCISEGHPSKGYPHMQGTEWQRSHVKAWYKNLWDSINGKTYPWSSNCWVWAYTYELVVGKR